MSPKLNFDQKSNLNETLDEKMKELEEMHKLVRMSESFIYPTKLLDNIVQTIVTKTTQDHLFANLKNSSACMML